MASQRRPLTVYHIRKHIDGQRVSNFEQIIRDQVEVEAFDPNEGLELPFQARLFVAVSLPKIPAWSDLLSDAFNELVIPEIRQVNAVLLIKISYYGDQYFAITFGHGRHLLKPGCFDRSYGLRVALNIIYEQSTDNFSLSRLRSVDSKTVAENTLRTRRQADRRATFETFGVDIQQDLLKAINGSPVKSSIWGTRVSGADSFSANPEIEFSALGDYCKQIARAYRKDIYEENFRWVDNLQVITDPETLNHLHTLLIQKIHDIKPIALAMPELVEWDDIDKFRFSFDKEQTFKDLDDSNIYDSLSSKDLMDELDIDHLRNRWRLEAIDNNGDLFGSWPLMQCLAAEIDYDGESYILSEGEFYNVRKEYLTDLDSFISALKESTNVLPNSPGDIPEGDYNEIAANSSVSYLLLDKKTVRISNNTSSIEICDILTKNGSFIHVKRKLGSSSLSHLFAQGTVSADLFLMNKEYRNVTLQMIKDQEEARAAETNDNAFKGRFSTFDADGISPGKHEVVYAIVAKWRGRSVTEALPFFSKVNLRRHVEELQRMGYRVSMARVDVDEG